MQAISIDTGSSLAIVPVHVDHTPLLAALVTKDQAHLHAYLPRVATLSSNETARAHLERAALHAAAGEIFEWHLFLDERLCGSMRLRDIDHDDHKAAIGYFLSSEFTGRGIVTTALRAVLAWSFGPLALNRIELHCAAGNAPSVRVAERLGFVREGVLRQNECLNGVFVDHYVYGLLRADFERGT